MAGISYANPTTGFTALVAETGPKWVSSKDHFVNAMARNNYESLFWALRGRRMADMFIGGSDIRERVKFEKDSNSKWYRWGENQGAGINQEGKTVLEYWRYAMHGGSWQEEAMDMNAGEDMNSKARAESYKNQWKSYFMNLHTDIVEFYDDALWAKPNYDDMEGVDGVQIKSLPVYLNAGTNGLFNQGSSNGGAWTTIHGINPAASATTKYKPWQGTYGTAAGSGFAAGHPDNVIFALDVAIEKTKFKAPPLFKEDFDSDSEGFQVESGYLATSLWGRTLMKSCYRNHQDHWANQNDPYGNPLYAGIPVVWVQKLDRAPLYLTVDGTTTVWEGYNAGALTDNGSVATYGPRFYGVTPSSFRLIWNSNRYLKPIGPINSREQPTRFTKYWNSAAAMFCADRRKGFIITPVVDQTAILPPATGSSVSTPPPPSA